jgi:hypothetical protein
MVEDSSLVLSAKLKQTQDDMRIFKRCIDINKQIMGARVASELCILIEAHVAEFNHVLSFASTEALSSEWRTALSSTCSFFTSTNVITASTPTLVAPLRPACLGGRRLLVLLVLPLRLPFHCVWLLLVLRRGLILLLGLVLRGELHTTVVIRTPPHPDLTLPI